MGDTSLKQTVSQAKVLYVLFIAFELVLASIFAVEILNLIAGLKSIPDPTILFWIGFFYTIIVLIMVYFLYAVGDKIRDVLVK